MSRKTIDIIALRKQVNEMLADSTCGAEQRVGMCQVLETALHASGNYNGFGYLKEDQVPSGHKPGINDVDISSYADNTSEEHDRLYKERFNNTDDSRRHYY